MLIGLYFLLKEVVLPKLVDDLAPAFDVAFNYAMLFLIILAGIAILFSVVGIKTTGPGMSNQIVSGVIKALGFIGKTLVELAKYLGKSYVKILKDVFNILKKKNLALAWILTILIGIVII